MAVLQNTTRQQLIAPQLQIASSFKDRGLGLLAHKSLEEGQGLWILHCNSIHTFFMKFTIDCIFVDKKLKVKALKKSVAPWRLILPVWGASSVFELPEGTIDRWQILVGDQLYVGH